MPEATVRERPPSPPISEERLTIRAALHCFGHSVDESACDLMNALNPLLH
jgi:hypothetical protein